MYILVLENLEEFIDMLSFFVEMERKFGIFGIMETVCPLFWLL
jgi:hypothetical protein